MHLSINMDGSAHRFPETSKKRKSRWYYPSHGDDLDLEGDKVIKTLPEENRRRRTIILYKLNNSWGFTIQSYGIHHKKDQEIEMLTYVDYIAPGGAGFQAGMRQGDVILSINGRSMEQADHKELVEFIKSAGDTMRMVVLFEDCCKKVELHLRYIKLQRILMEKIFELRSLEYQEKRIMKGLPQFDSRYSSRSSSSTSLNSSFDDRLSLRPELDRCPSPLVLSGTGRSPGRSPGSSPRNSALRLARQDFERASMPAGLKYLSKKPGGASSSISDVSEIKNKKRPFSLNVGEFLPRPNFHLSPHGGAKSKVPIKKMPSAPSSVSRRQKHRKPKVDHFEMNTFKLKLGDGDGIGSSSTDDMDTIALWTPEASPRLRGKSRGSHGYDDDVTGSVRSLNSSGCGSAVFSLGSPDPGNVPDFGSDPFAHSTPREVTTTNNNDDTGHPRPEQGSETFYDTLTESDEDSLIKPGAESDEHCLIKPSATSIPGSVLTTSFRGSIPTSTSNSASFSPLYRDSGLCDLSSPVSMDSEASSHFSYSDIPAITISFVNENDEVTHL